MTEHSTHNPREHQGRHDRLIRELDHDPYHAKHKHKGPAYCPECGAVYDEGRWRWGEAGTEADEHRCPSCQRIADGVPAAFLTLQGDFLAGHRDEIQHLIANYEERERAEHPLKRIMGREDRNDGAVVYTFTDAHLARGVGEALHHAYQGDLDLHYQKGEILLRVTWSR